MVVQRPSLQHGATLRLNVEASDRETMTRIRDEVLRLIRGATVPAGDVKERPE